MKLIFALSILLTSTSAFASDSLVISCGASHEKGPEHSELALVDDVENGTEFYKDGVALEDDDYDVTARDAGWIVTVRGADGNGEHKYEFDQDKKVVQEIKIGSKPAKKIGAAKSCTVTGA